MKREKIIKNYLKTYFFIDLISLGCIILPMTSSSNWNYLQVIFLIKYFKLRNY